MCKCDCPPEYLVNKEQSLCAGLSVAALSFGAPPTEMKCDVKIPWDILIKIGYSIGIASLLILMIIFKVIEATERVSV